MLESRIGYNLMVIMQLSDHSWGVDATKNIMQLFMVNNQTVIMNYINLIESKKSDEAQKYFDNEIQQFHAKKLTVSDTESEASARCKKVKEAYQDIRGGTDSDSDFDVDTFTL